MLVAGLTIASITYGALLGIFLLGIWNRRANENWRPCRIRGGFVSDDRRKIFHAAGLDLVRAGGNNRHIRGRISCKRALPSAKTASQAAALNWNATGRERNYRDTSKNR